MRVDSTSNDCKTKLISTLIIVTQLWLFAPFSQGNALAQPLPNTNCSKGTVVVFGNGMFNEELDVWLSSASLRLAMTQAGIDNQIEPITKNVQYDIAHNHSEAWYSQAIQVYTQKVGNNVELFWQMLANVEDQPDWFREMLLNISKEYAVRQSVNDADLRDHIQKYKSYLNEGYRVLIVSHSQGNLYANFAYSNLKDQYGRNIGNVQVATPTNFVAAGGPWETFPDDRVMAFVRLFVNALPALIPANGAAPAPQGDPDGHNFIKSYMRVGVSRDRILRDIVNVSRSLAYPQAIAQAGVMTITLTWGTQPDVDLHVFEPSGKHVYYSNKKGIIGYLDLDDVSSYGPEHYYVSCDKLQEGDYRIGVNYFRGAQPETAIIDFKAGSEIAQKKVSLTKGVGSSGNNTPIIAGTVRVTKDSSGQFQFNIISQ